MLVFQYDVIKGRWVYINPPGKQLTLEAPDFEAENLHKKTEFKVYSLLEQGPKIPKGAASEPNMKAYDKVQLLHGGHSTDCAPYLRLPRLKPKNDVFDKLDLLTQTSGPYQREAYHEDKLRFLDNWLRLKREIDSTPEVDAGKEIIPDCMPGYGLWRQQHL